MATTAFIRQRLRRLGIFSVLGTILFGCWLLRFSSGERILPSLIRIGPRPRVTLRQGTYVGCEVKENFPQVLEQFLGIRYGQSTAGERRFRAPLPVSASNETFDSTEYGDRCPAGAPDMAGEDCLNLNIWRPKKRLEGKKLPVLVHVYGGSFNFGFDRTRQVDNMVAWSTEPFIGITFNYRVGALGFLPSTLTAKEGLLNAGLKDQGLLLQWVQENIAEFGGDPDDVTVMGSSAGAHSVRSSLTSFLSKFQAGSGSAFLSSHHRVPLELQMKSAQYYVYHIPFEQKLTISKIGHHLMHNSTTPPPFHKLIIESGGPTARAVYTPSNPLHETQFQEFLALLGLEDTPSKRVTQALRNLLSAQISDAALSLFNSYNPSVRWPFQPAIDGPDGFIKEAPISAFKSGKFHKVPILTGFNTNEGAGFVPADTATEKEFVEFFRTLLPSLSKKDLNKLQKVYPDPLTDPSSPYKEDREGLGAQFKRLEQAYGQFAYICPVRHTAHFAALSDVPVYLYHFAVNSTVKGGADHGTNNPYPTYNEDIREVSDTIREVTGSMHAYWTSFITTGDPNMVLGRFPDRPVWPVYKPEKKSSGKVVLFGDGNDERAGGENEGVAVQVADDEFASEECKYWWDRNELFEL